MKSRNKKIDIESQGCRLRGEILFPESYAGGGEKLPVVIVSHGFGSCMKETKAYAEVFVRKGFAAVIYDFCMSGFRCRSTGKTTGMSVLTQKQDLLNLFEYVSALDFADSSRIVLAGCSQGGFVSSLAAVELEDRIKSLVMYYPALCIPDDCRRGQMINAKIDPDNIPETFHALYLKLSAKYVLDGKSLDPFKEICVLKKPVLIVHGIEDSLVNIEYSRKAASLYANCRLVEVHGDHGFFRNGFHASGEATEKYIDEVLLA